VADPITTRTTRQRVVAMVFVCGRRGHVAWQPEEPQTAFEQFPRCINCCFYLREGDDGNLHVL
jgi:hypothetical protein